MLRLSHALRSPFFACKILEPLRFLYRSKCDRQIGKTLVFIVRIIVIIIKKKKRRKCEMEAKEGESVLFWNNFTFNAVIPITNALCYFCRRFFCCCHFSRNTVQNFWLQFFQVQRFGANLRWKMPTRKIMSFSKDRHSN